MGLEFKCQVKALLGTLRQVFPAISGRSPLEILKHFLIKSEAGKLSVLGYDLEVAIRSVLEESVEIEAEGDLVMPGRFLIDLLSKFSGSATVSIKAGENIAFLTCGKSKYKLPCCRPEDYPAPPAMKETACVTLPAPSLRNLISQVIFAAAKDEARPILTGLHLDSTEGVLRAVATDTHRLAVSEIAIEMEPAQAIVPARLAALWSSALASTSEAPLPVHLMIGDKQAAITLHDGSLIVSGRTIEGKFPNWKRVVPSRHECMVTVDKEALLEIVQRLELVAQGNEHQICWDMTEDRLLLTAETPLEKAEEEIEIEMEGLFIETAFNGSYLNQALRAMPGDRVCFELLDKLKPALLRPAAESENGKYFQVLMPLHRD